MATRFARRNLQPNFFVLGRISSNAFREFTLVTPYLSKWV